MTPTRFVHSMVTALALLGAACSSSTSTSSASGGSKSSGGVSSQGGTTASGGQSGTGGVSGTGGATNQGGSKGETTLGSGGSSQPGTGGVNGTGGHTSPGTGGAGTGGQMGSGGAGIGDAAISTGGTVPTASGGNGARPGTGGSGSGGTSGSGSGGSSGGSAVDAGAAQSAGCGKTRTLQNGTLTITSGGASRKFILLVPSSYDSSHAYRMVFAFAESGSSAQSVATRNYFTMATYDSKNTIFAAPDAANGAGSWSNTDVAFTDAILAQLEGDLCIDKTRIFATGFSFGAGMAMALACTRADVFRAVAFFSGADLTGSCPTTLTKPIAYYASQASEDSNGMDITNPMTGEKKQAQFAAVNGCTAEPASTTFPAAGQPHTCTIYKGCSSGHPTEYCVFNGPHGWEPKDPGQATSWDAPEAWKFITQF